MDDRNVGQRVGNNPLVIEAVGSLDDDVYITSMDAEKVRDAEKSFGFYQIVGLCSYYNKWEVLLKTNE